MEYTNRTQKYRKKLREDPERFKEYLEKERERSRRRRYLKKVLMDEKAKEEKRKKDRDRQRRHRQCKRSNSNVEEDISQMLTNLFKTLKTQTENADLQEYERFQIIDIIKTLNATERSIVASQFCKLSWNIGSLRVLGILQDLRILTATEYILSLENNDDIQLILNDFLETEYDLVSNLFISFSFDSTNYIRITAIMSECLENLFRDLLIKPDLNDLKFLDYVSNNIPGEIVLKITGKILTLILGLHQSNVKEAFCKFSSWINEGVDELKFPQDMYKQLLCKHPQESLNHLLKCSAIENFKEWKFYLIMLQTISHYNNEVAGPYMRKHLKLKLKQCASMPCKRNFMHLLLTARAATANTMEITKNLDNYAEWYKQNIGEMKFFFSPDEFQNVLAMLDQCVNFEMEIDYLEIHSLIAISPPVLCGKLVQTYKSKCKQRLQQIKKGILQVDAINESILIEDSN